MGARIMVAVYAALAAVGAVWMRRMWREARRSGMGVTRRGGRRHVVVGGGRPKAFDWRDAPPEGKEGAAARPASKKSKGE